MEEMAKHGQVGLAAMRAGMDRKTARKYVKARRSCRRSWRRRGSGGRGRTRSRRTGRRWPSGWRRRRGSRPRRSSSCWCEEHPGRYEPGQLRTLQRRVRRWRAQRGPEREIFFAQAHRPGEAAQTDFTATAELAVTIAGRAVRCTCSACSCCRSRTGSGRPCACRSRWRRCGAGCRRRCSSSGGCREFHQTDNSTAATHQIPSGRRRGGERQRLQRRVPRADAALRDEAADDRGRGQGAKRRRGGQQRRAQARLEQPAGARQPRLREHRGVRALRRTRWSRKANASRGPRVAEELAAMRPLVVARLPEYAEDDGAVVIDGARSGCKSLRLLGAVAADRRTGAGARLRGPASRCYYAEQACELACERLRGKTAPHRLPARHLVAGAEAGRASRATSTARSCFPSLDLPARLRRDPGDQPGRQGRPSSTCASCTWPRARWRPTSRPALELLLAERRPIDRGRTMKAHQSTAPASRGARARGAAGRPRPSTTSCSSRRWRHDHAVTGKPSALERSLVLLRALKLPAFAAARRGDRAQGRAARAGPSSHYLQPPGRAGDRGAPNAVASIAALRKDSELPAEKTLATLERERLPRQGA